MKPLIDNLKVLFRSKPLTLSVLGIAFFIFMVSYMRATMYMHGETRNPRWDEFKISLIVATVALGVGLGSPLAGYLSGGKIELGLVPLGCMGMILATLLAALMINHTSFLVAALIIMGFFSGFYMVPLYTLLQHRAPKTSKGELVATSNFINVTGAIAASVLFFLLGLACEAMGITPLIKEIDNDAVGVLTDWQEDEKGRLTEIIITTDKGWDQVYRAQSVAKKIDFNEDDQKYIEEYWEEVSIIEYPDNLFEIFGAAPKKGDRVIVSKFTLRDVDHYNLRFADQPLKPNYDYESLPPYLFLGAALMTLGILILLLRQLPDFFVRTLFWMRSLGRFRLKAVGMQHLPTSGPVLLASNCDRLENSLQLVSVTDRYTTIVLADSAGGDAGFLLESLARRSTLVMLTPGAGLQYAEARARAALAGGNLIAIGIDGKASPELEKLLDEFREQAPVVPVFCGPIDEAGAAKPRIRVVFGKEIAGAFTFDELRAQIRELGEWIKKNDDIAGVTEH